MSPEISLNGPMVLNNNEWYSMAISGMALEPSCFVRV